MIWSKRALFLGEFFFFFIMTRIECKEWTWTPEYLPIAVFIIRFSFLFVGAAFEGYMVPVFCYWKNICELVTWFLLFTRRPSSKIRWFWWRCFGQMRKTNDGIDKKNHRIFRSISRIRKESKTLPSPRLLQPGGDENEAQVNGMSRDLHPIDIDYAWISKHHRVYRVYRLYVNNN